jgi:hypothetical protein
MSFEPAFTEQDARRTQILLWPVTQALNAAWFVAMWREVGCHGWGKWGRAL